jgi:hypothetical protein
MVYAQSHEAMTGFRPNRREMLRATGGFAGVSLLGSFGISSALADEMAGRRSC